MIVRGHGLRHEGARVYDQHGHNVGRTLGTHGKCRCGELFDEPSIAAVQRAHNDHKDKVLIERQNGGAA